MVCCQAGSSAAPCTAASTNAAAVAGARTITSFRVLGCALFQEKPASSSPFSPLETQLLTPELALAAGWLSIPLRAEGALKERVKKGRAARRSRAATAVVLGLVNVPMPAR